MGKSTDRGGRSAIHQLERSRNRPWRVQRASEPKQSSSGARSGGVRHYAPVRGELHLRLTVGAERTLGAVMEPNRKSISRKLAGLRYSCPPERIAIDRDSWRKHRSQPRQRSRRSAESRWKS